MLRRFMFLIKLSFNIPNGSELVKRSMRTNSTEIFS